MNVPRGREVPYWVCATGNTPCFAMAAPKESIFPTCAARQDPPFKKHIRFFVIFSSKALFHVWASSESPPTSKGPLPLPPLFKPSVAHIYHFHIWVHPPPPRKMCEAPWKNSWTDLGRFIKTGPRTRGWGCYLGITLVRMCGPTFQNPPPFIYPGSELGTHLYTYRSKLPTIRILVWGTE